MCTRRRGAAPAHRYPSSQSVARRSAALRSLTLAHHPGRSSISKRDAVLPVVGSGLSRVPPNLHRMYIVCYRESRVNFRQLRNSKSASRETDLRGNARARPRTGRRYRSIEIDSRIRSRARGSWRIVNSMSRLSVCASVWYPRSNTLRRVPTFGMSSRIICRASRIWLSTSSDVLTYCRYERSSRAPVPRCGAPRAVQSRASLGLAPRRGACLALRAVSPLPSWRYDA